MSVIVPVRVSVSYWYRTLKIKTIGTRTGIGTDCFRNMDNSYFSEQCYDKFRKSYRYGYRSYRLSYRWLENEDYAISLGTIGTRTSMRTGTNTGTKGHVPTYRY